MTPTPSPKGMNAMRLKLFVAAVAVAACLFGARLTAIADDNKVKKDPGTFGALESVPADVAKARSLAWLKKATNSDAAKLQAFELRAAGRRIAAFCRS